MKRSILLLLFVLAGYATKVNAQTSNTIVQAVSSLSEHATLSSAITNCEMASLLNGQGPYTFFAPGNSAFEKLPRGALANLLKPENKMIMSRFINCHIVQGNLDAATISQNIERGGGSATFTTVSGNKLVATLENGKIKLTDELGGFALVTIKDIKAGNGIIHGVDALLMPR